MIRLSYPDLVTVMSSPLITWKLGPLNLISLGRGVLHVDPPDGNQCVLVHRDVVAPDQLLELHSHVIIKKDQHEIPGYYQLNLYFALRTSYKL